MSWTSYTPHNKHTAPDNARSTDAHIADPTPRFDDPTLTPIESAPAQHVGALSTSELAPILDRARNRFRLAPVIVSVLLTGSLLAWGAGNSVVATALGIGCLFLGVAAATLDSYRRSVEIEYEPTGLASEVAQAIAHTFEPLKRAAAVWSVEAAGHTADWKRHAGASELNDRKKIQLHLGRPACIRGVMSVPCINFGVQSLYFLPDATLFVDKNSVAALHYRDIAINKDIVRFIEDERVPRDASIVDYTWRFVNRNGSPDRRFNNNRQLPICAYGQIDVQSEGGLNGRLHISDSNAGDEFVKLVGVIAQYADTDETTRSVRSYREPKSWPTIAFLIVFLLFGLAVFVVGAANIRATEPGKNRAALDASSTTVVPKSQAPPTEPKRTAAPNTEATMDTPMAIVPSSNAAISPGAVPPLPRLRPR